MASEQLVKHCAESVDVRGARNARVISHCLFRRHITGSAQNFHRARSGTLCFDQPGQPEIGEMRFAFCVEQDVSGFDVSMQNAVFMRVMNCAGQLGDQFCCVTERYRFALRDSIELAALYQSHAEVTGAVALSDFVNRDDVRMVQAGGGFCFETKALYVCFCGPVSETNHFERHNTVQTFLSCPINHALATVSDFFE